MPELPEVETTLRGLKPHINQQVIRHITLRHTQLRWPIPLKIKKILPGQTLQRLWRRGKYLLLETEAGTLILHLGMSGSLCILPDSRSPGKHDHLDIQLDNGKVLRLTDPRRFGAVLWTTENPLCHPLLKNLGPEPLHSAFSGDLLWRRCQGRKLAIKSFIMDSNIVVGVGNIYATEALFASDISPLRPAGKLSLLQADKLVSAIKETLRAAIRQGGTTLKDFMHSDGKLGYFKTHLKVYGRGGLPCLTCKTPLKEIRLGQRSTVYCTRCQS